MGYIEAASGKWTKPVAYQLLTYEENKSLWTNWFKTMSGDIGIYESRTMNAEDNYLNSLKQFEGETRIDCGSRVTSFERIAFDL